MDSVILQLLPYAISIWTGLTLAWGVYVGYWFDRMINKDSPFPTRSEDYSYILCIWGANIVIFVLGFVVPFAAPTIRSSVGDAVLVINAFYTSFLVICTIGLFRWASRHDGAELTETE